MKPIKTFGTVFFLVGLACVLFGVMFCGTFLHVYRVTRDSEALTGIWIGGGVSLILALTFSAIGLSFLRQCRETDSEKQLVFADPDYVIKDAEIISFVDTDGILVNGMGPCCPVIKGIINGEERELVCANKTYKAGQYQLGARCTVYVRSTTVWIDDDSIRLI